MEKVDHSGKARDFMIYTVTVIGCLLYFNLSRAYKGENIGIHISFAAILLFELSYYLYCFTNKDRFLWPLYAKVRAGLQVAMFLNALVMAYYGPNESWLFAIIYFAAFMLVEKRAFLFRQLAIMEKYGPTAEELEEEKRISNS